MNTLNAPTVTNIALLILGYLNKDSKLYFPKFGDESLGWFPHTPLKVFLCVCAGTCTWVYCGVFLNYRYILYKLKKTPNHSNKTQKRKTKQTYTKRKANLVFSIIQSNIKIAKIGFFKVYD